MDFLFYIGENYTIGSEGTMAQYIRQFQQLYRLVSGKYMDRNDSEEVYKVLQMLC
jgi:hypothetical protein